MNADDGVIQVRAVTKAERNDLLRSALRQHGTLIGAAAEVGVDRATVRRLVSKCSDAAVALWEGRKDRIGERIAKHQRRLTMARDIARRITNSIRDARERIRVDNAGMSYSEIRELDKSLAEMIPREKSSQTRVHQRQRSVKEAEERLLEHQDLHPLRSKEDRPEEEDE